MVYGGIAGGAIGAAGGYATAAPGQEKMGIFKGAMLGAGIGAVGGAARHGVKWDATNKAMQEEMKRKAAAAANNMAKGNKPNSWNPIEGIKKMFSKPKQENLLAPKKEARDVGFEVAGMFKGDKGPSVPSGIHRVEGLGSTDEALGMVNSTLGLPKSLKGTPPPLPSKGEIIPEVGLGSLGGQQWGGGAKGEQLGFGFNTPAVKAKPEPIGPYGSLMQGGKPSSNPRQGNLFADNWMDKRPIMEPPGMGTAPGVPDPIDNLAKGLMDADNDMGLFSPYRGLGSTLPNAQRRNRAGQFMSNR